MKSVHFLHFSKLHNEEEQDTKIIQKDKSDVAIKSSDFKSSTCRSINFIQTIN